jgi:cysteinyl-tRNA synthetase
MALTTLGPALDLHVGGADLRYPHHTYEAAMAEAVTGVTPFARAWLHVGTVGLDGAKMAKSTGNLVLVSEVLDKHPAAALRLLLVERPWADAWEYDPAGLAAAETRLERLYGAAARGALEAGTPAARDVTAALLDDLDVPRALAVAEEAGGEAARIALSVLGLA